MRNLVQLRINEGGRPVLRLPPSVTTIELFERTYKVELPVGIRKLLAISNGGHPELDSIKGQHGEFAIDTFYHLPKDDRGPESFWYAIDHWRPILGAKALPFASDGGGNQFFIDLDSAEQPVKICLHDRDMTVLVVARSFEQLIDSLSVNPDFI
jgi:cell wall assembly regulator SMI1